MSADEKLEAAEFEEPINGLDVLAAAEEAATESCTTSMFQLSRMLMERTKVAKPA